jgi:hypothetical protein
MDVVERYILLTLRIGRHIDGFVDAYYGPPELAERVGGEEAAAPEALADEARDLAGALLGALGDAQRERWLAAQVGGLTAVAERLAGVKMTFADEVRRCYGMEFLPPAERELEEAHRRLDELVPGAGDLGERFRAWRRERQLPADVVLKAAGVVTDELRRRTTELFGLPDGEDGELELVSGQSWSGFNYYLGGLRSRVSINTDIPMRAEALPDLLAHEFYPGHHTEHATKEVALVQGLGRLEETIAPVGTPQSLVAEGIAMNGLGILGVEAERACARILGDLGHGYDVDLIRAVREVDKTLDRVDDCVAGIIHGEGRSVDEARDFARRWSLRPDDEVDKLIEFTLDPVSRSYIVVYATGWRLVEEWTGGDPARFRRLLTEQVTAADLVGA